MFIIIVKIPALRDVYGSQWLRRHASNVGGMGSIPGQGTKIPHAMWQKKKKNPTLIWESSWEPKEREKTPCLLHCQSLWSSSQQAPSGSCRIPFSRDMIHSAALCIQWAAKIIKATGCMPNCHFILCCVDTVLSMWNSPKALNIIFGLISSSLLLRV